MENNNEAFKALTEAFNVMAEPIHEDVLELNARLSAQRFLLEQLYANAFLGNPEGFENFISGAQATVQKSTRSNPMPEDYAQELQARIATHIQRFGESVSRRLQEG